MRFGLDRVRLWSSLPTSFRVTSPALRQKSFLQCVIGWVGEGVINLKGSEVRKSKSFARIILPPQNKAQRKCFCFVGYTVFNPIAAHIHKWYCFVVRLSGVLNGSAQQSPKRVFLMTSSTGNIFALQALCEGNWSVTEKPVKQTIELLVIWDVIALIMTSL